MSFLLTIQMPENDIVHEQPTPHAERIAALEMQYQEVGRTFNNKKIINCIVNSTYVWPGQLDENGDPMAASPLPPSWQLLSVHEIKRGSDLLESIPGTPVVHDAATLTDATINRSQRYHRYYVRPVIDNTDPDNPVITGVNLLDREHNLVETIPGVTPDADGSYTKTWTEPGKNVPGGGKVPLTSLEPNGDFIEIPYTISVKAPALVERVAMDTATYISHMPDELDENGQNPTRPTVAAEISLFGGYRRAL